MTTHPDFTVQLHLGADAARLEPQLRQVYRDAFAGLPYNKTQADEDANFDRFHRQVRQPGFRAVLATDPDSEPIGLAYGYPVPATTGWWNTLHTPAAPDLAREDGHRTFGLHELAVRPAWQRRGVATTMLDTLVAGTSFARILLNTRPDALPAAAAYAAWGYRPVGDNSPWPGAAPHRLLLKDLPPTTRIREMHLRRAFFDQVASHAKTIEIRVAYPHLYDLAPGQRIRFLCDDDQVLVDVLRVTAYSDFDALLDAEPVERINPSATRGEQLTVLRDIYPAAKEQLGALAIEIRRAPPTSRSRRGER